MRRAHCTEHRRMKTNPIRQAAGVQPVLASTLGLTQSSALMLVGAFAWAGCCAAWALRYGRWFGLPRADGRPG